MPSNPQLKLMTELLQLEGVIVTNLTDGHIFFGAMRTFLVQ